jgi:hypothetical protein
MTRDRPYEISAVEKRRGFVCTTQQCIKDYTLVSTLQRKSALIALFAIVLSFASQHPPCVSLAALSTHSPHFMHERSHTRTIGYPHMTYDCHIIGPTSTE